MNSEVHINVIEELNLEKSFFSMIDSFIEKEDKSSRERNLDELQDLVNYSDAEVASGGDKTTLPLSELDGLQDHIENLKKKLWKAKILRCLFRTR